MLIMKNSDAIHQLIKNFKSPAYIMLVGPPGVGKSTFIKQYLNHIGMAKMNFHVASTDDIIEKIAAENGRTYSETFHNVNQKLIKKEMEVGIKQAFQDNISIIHDQTNMSRKSRASKLINIPDNYQKICLNFILDEKVLMERLDNRAKLTGKTIPQFVMKSMLNNYEVPTEAEGFNLIIQVETD